MPLKPSLKFAGKARAYLSEESLRCPSLGQAPGLTSKYQTILERLARDKHSCLLRKLVNYVQKCFITLVLGIVFTVRTGFINVCVFQTFVQLGFNLSNGVTDTLESTSILISGNTKGGAAVQLTSGLTGLESAA